jgi:DNA-binding transcriptional LysR family regulator
MKQNFTVRQGALDGVEAFLSVAQHRSFRRAAAQLGVTPSAISQAVRALEARIGAVLFIRTTRSVGLTEAGERFLSRARPAFEELVAASGAARELGQRPAGLLRLTVPRAVVPILLEPVVASFRRAYPEVEVEIAVSEELIDLAAEGFDAGIRLGQFIAADMVAVRLTKPFPFIIVGSPAYLARSGRPERPDDLRQHACLRLRRSNGALMRLAESVGRGMKRFLIFLLHFATGSPHLDGSVNFVGVLFPGMALAPGMAQARSAIATIIPTLSGADETAPEQPLPCSCP